MTIKRNVSYLANLGYALTRLLAALIGADYRVALINAGILPNQIETALNSIEDEVEKAKALTEWEYALVFDRSHSLIAAIADQLNVTEKDIDDLFRDAAKI